MRIISRNALSVLRITLTMGFIGLLITPLIHAQDFPADITRGKGVYQRNCQACHGVGGWGDGPEAQALKIPPANFHRFSSFLKSDEKKNCYGPLNTVSSSAPCIRGEAS